MKEYKVTWKSKLQNTWLYLLILVFYPFIVKYLMIYKEGYFDVTEAFIWGGGFLIFYSIPFIAIHLNHLSKSRNVIFKFDRDSSTIFIKTNDIEHSIGIEDIANITVFKSWPLARNGGPIFAWDFYHFMKIELKNGDIFNVSSLLLYEPDKLLKLNMVKVERRFYAWIK